MSELERRQDEARRTHAPPPPRSNPWASPLPAPAYCKPCWGRVAHCSRCDMYGPSYEGRVFQCTRCKPPYFLETTGKYAFRRCILPPIGPIG